jgi:hypothetical protein
MNREIDSFYADVQRKISNANGAHESLINCVINYMRNKNYYESVKDQSGIISIDKIVKEAISDECSDKSLELFLIGWIFLVFLPIFILFKSCFKYFKKPHVNS